MQGVCLYEKPQVTQLQIGRNRYGTRNNLPQVSILTMILQHDERYNPLSRTP